jgi:hypothetical protein
MKDPGAAGTARGVIETERSFDMEDDSGYQPDDGSTPADFTCLDVHGHPVFVMPGGECQIGDLRFRYITIAVRDTDQKPFRREDCRALIDVDPMDAIRLARELLDYASDSIGDFFDVYAAEPRKDTAENNEGGES